MMKDQPDRTVKGNCDEHPVASVFWFLPTPLQGCSGDAAGHHE